MPEEDERTEMDKLSDLQHELKRKLPENSREAASKGTEQDGLGTFGFGN